MEKNKQYIATGLIPFLFLSGATITNTIIGYIISSDVRGWWPMILVVSSFFNLIYTLFWHLISSKYPLSIKCSSIINGLVAILMILFACLYYLYPIDWNAINNGTKSLTFIENIIYSDIDLLILYSLGLIIAYIVGKWSNKH